MNTIMLERIRSEERGQANRSWISSFMYALPLGIVITLSFLSRFSG